MYDGKKFWVRQGGSWSMVKNIHTVWQNKTRCLDVLTIFKQGVTQLISRHSTPLYSAMRGITRQVVLGISTLPLTEGLGKFWSLQCLTDKIQQEMRV